MAAARIVILAVALALGAPGVGTADLSNVEKFELTKLHYAHGELVVNAAHCLGNAIRNHTSPASDAHIYKTGRDLHLMIEQVEYALALLLDANPYEPGTPTHATQEARTRAERVADGFAAADGALRLAGPTMALTAAALGISGPLDNDFNCIKMAVDRAASYLKSLNRSLGYLGTRTTAWWPQCVGPHGHCPTAMNRVANGLLRINAGMKAAMESYYSRGLGEPIWTGSGDGQPLDVFYTVVTAGDFRAAQSLSIVLFNLALIPLTLEQCTFDDFHLVARTMERLSLHSSESGSATPGSKGGQVFGMPYNFTVAMGIWWNGLKAGGLGHRPRSWAKFDAFESNWFRAWQFTDGAWENILEFPRGMPTLAELRAQARRGSSQLNAAPICPDAEPPTTTLTAPSASETVRGTVRVRAECSDNLKCIKVRIEIDGADVGVDVVQPNSGMSKYRLVGNTTSGSPTVSGIPGHPGIVGFYVGQAVTGPGIPAGATIRSLGPCGDLCSLTLSVNANATAAGVPLTYIQPTTYTHPWDTTTAGDGTHTIRAIGYDANGNRGASAPVTVTVDNASARSGGAR